MAWVIKMYLILRKPEIYYGALDNLAHTLPAGTSESELRSAVHRLMGHTTRGYYHLFHNLGQEDFRLDKLDPPVRISSEVQGFLDGAFAQGRGLFIAGTHMSNFDLGGIALSYYTPVPPQALSIADPAPGHEFVNQLRLKGRGKLTPVSPGALREAMQRLREGGIVITGVDHPLTQGNRPVRFFGKTACLPVGYIRIPLAADALVMTVSFVYDGEAYHILGNPPFEMIRTGDRQRDVELNVARILAEIEDFVRLAPDQWMIFERVWAE
ncbi:MAG: lysophospholipid acyltransferase family protein [Anaerolineae bacterium]